MYIIQNTNEYWLYWNTETGWWGDWGDASPFTEEEKELFDLPINGQWVEDRLEDYEIYGFGGEQFLEE